MQRIAVAEVRAVPSGAAVAVLSAAAVFCQSCLLRCAANCPGAHRTVLHGRKPGSGESLCILQPVCAIIIIIIIVLLSSFAALRLIATDRIAWSVCTSVCLCVCLSVCWSHS